MKNMLTEEKINKNYLIWIESLKKYGCYSDELITNLGESIKNASFGLSTNSGTAYKGSLLDIVLYNLCVIATHINENCFGMTTKEKKRHEALYVSPNSLMKVLLLQHISKAEMFIPNANEWSIKKGYLYDFNNALVSNLKLGERSLYICQKYGITFTEEEYEAMRIIDKEEEKTTNFTNPLSELVKISNQLASIEKYRSIL